MGQILLSCLVAALVFFSASGAYASDATTAQLVMAANAAATQDGGKASIASLFATKFATGLSQGQTMTLSVTHGTFGPEGLAPDTFLSLFIGNGAVQETLSWGPFSQPGAGCTEAVPRCIAPTKLGGVEVRVNGKKAAIAFVLKGSDFDPPVPDQVNFISPDDDAVGDGIEVEISNAAGLSQKTVIQLLQRAPGFFAFDPQGRRFLAAVQNDGSAFIGPAGLFGGAPLPNGLEIRPAKPGDIIQLFGTEFGPTDPKIPSGMIPTAIAELADKDMLVVTVGGQPAEVFFAGLTSFAGAIQLVIRVPAVGDGDQAVIASANAGRRFHTGPEHAVSAAG